MKVLFVSSGNSRYGIVPFIKCQGESLKSEGVELDFYLIKGKGIKGYVKCITPLRRFLRSNNCDIVHAHYGLIGLVCVLTFSRIPIVLSVMGDDAYGSFDIHGKRIKSSYLNMLLTQIALIFAKRIIVKSKNILKFIPYKKKSQIIPNGVDFNVFKPSDNKLKPNTILSLADPNDFRKNFNLVKKALDLIKDNKLKLLNPFPINHSQFPEYLNNCSVFVLTSYNEGSPNVIKEAMACNIPIVATDVGDVKEIIGKTEGCFITTFRPEDVADKIIRALAFGKRTIGRENIKHLESQTIAKRIIEVYNKVLKK